MKSMISEEEYILTGEELKKKMLSAASTSRDGSRSGPVKTVRIPKNLHKVVKS